MSLQRLAKIAQHLAAASVQQQEQQLERADTFGSSTHAPTHKITAPMPAIGALEEVADFGDFQPTGVAVSIRYFPARFSGCCEHLH